ncbi:MAG: uroporphyrinogen-III synthase [Campylobacterales bacterium]|nr:uroporphyrinogen-III synthase [Campylobacterales bacterium]
MIYLLSQSKKDKVISLPVIETFGVVNSIDFKNYDTLLFTSKNCVEIVDAIDEHWKDLKIISIGKATTQKIKELGGDVILSSKGYGTSLVEDIATHFSHLKILFLRPKVVATQVGLNLKNFGVSIDEKIVYETQCVLYDMSKRPKKGSIIIFTSPSTVKCFLKSFSWDMSYKAIAIGTVTAKALPKGVDCIIPREPLIDSCVQEAQKLEKNS